jgi:hypothetical protein
MDVTGATWRTSGYTSSGGNCVEAGNHPQDRRVLIRDTKTAGDQGWPSTPVLAELHRGDGDSAPIALNTTGATGHQPPVGEAEYQVGRDATPLTGSARNSSHQ